MSWQPGRITRPQVRRQAPHCKQQTWRACASFWLKPDSRHATGGARAVGGLQHASHGGASAVRACQCTALQYSKCSWQLFRRLLQDVAGVLSNDAAPHAVQGCKAAGRSIASTAVCQGEYVQSHLRPTTSLLAQAMPTRARAPAEVPHYLKTDE